MSKKIENFKRRWLKAIDKMEASLGIELYVKYKWEYEERLYYSYKVFSKDLFLIVEYDKKKDPFFKISFVKIGNNNRVIARLTKEMKKAYLEKKALIEDIQEQL